MLYLWWSADKVFVNFGPFMFLYPIFGPKNQNFEKMKKKTPTDIIILHTLKCLINLEVKINVILRDFSQI